MMSIAPDLIATLAERAAPGCTVVDVTPLHGGISYQSVVVDVLDAGVPRRLTMRRSPEPALDRHPLRVENEFRVLRAVRSRGVRAPAPICVYGEDAGSPPCAMVLEFIEGRPAVAVHDSARLARRLARHLAALHAVDWRDADFTYLDARRASVEKWIRNAPQSPDDELREGTIRDALRDAQPRTRRSDVLVHGDVWPGNVLVDESEEIVGIIDWEDALFSDPLQDVAVTRLDLLWAFDRDTMNAFTQEYLSAHGETLDGLPYWDLVAALRPAGHIDEWAAGWPDMGRADVTRERFVTRHRAFVDDALRRLH